MLCATLCRGQVRLTRGAQHGVSIPWDIDTQRDIDTWHRYLPVELCVVCHCESTTGEKLVQWFSGSGIYRDPREAAAGPGQPGEPGEAGARLGLGFWLEGESLWCQVE